MIDREVREDLDPVVARADDLLVIVARARFDDRRDIAADVVDAADGGRIASDFAAWDGGT